MDKEFSGTKMRWLDMKKLLASIELFDCLIGCGMDYYSPLQSSSLFPKENPLPNKELCYVSLSSLALGKASFSHLIFLASVHALQDFVGFALILALGLDFRTMGKTLWL